MLGYRKDLEFKRAVVRVHMLHSACVEMETAYSDFGWAMGKAYIEVWAYY